MGVFGFSLLIISKTSLSNLMSVSTISSNLFLFNKDWDALPLSSLAFILFEYDIQFLPTWKAHIGLLYRPLPDRFILARYLSKFLYQSI